MTESKYLVSIHPHISSGQETPVIMKDVLIGLLPALAAAIWFFGWPTLWLVGTCVFFCVFSEYLWQKYLNLPVSIGDFSAAVTGVLLAFCLPPALPLWMAALGSIFSIIIVKQLFGGLGFNIFNPALAARAILLSSWPVAMTTWTLPKGIQAVTTATPLAIAKLGETSAVLPGYWQLFIGNVGGSLGETSALALLIGAIYLFYRRVIDGWIPFSYLFTVAGLSFLLGKDPLFHLLAGGLFLGAFFMATDYVTTPITRKGKLIFGVGCGILTVLIRLFGGYPEGVCYAILLMNLAAPLIDIYTKNRPFGVTRKK